MFRILRNMVGSTVNFLIDIEQFYFDIKFHSAVDTNNLAEIKKYLDEGISPSRSITALIDAMKKGQMDAVYLILESGLDLNAPGLNNESALHRAFDMREIKMMHLLLQRGADINKKNKYGLTLLYRACQADLGMYVQFLLEHGADKNAKNDYEMNRPLHIAKSECIKLLLMHKADINVKNKYGHTALHYAVYRNDIESARLLLDAGIDPESKNKKNNTALECALLYNQDEIVQLILRAIARREQAKIKKAGSACATFLQVLRALNKNNPLVATAFPKEIRDVIHSYIFPFPKKEKEKKCFLEKMAKVESILSTQGDSLFNRHSNDDRSQHKKHTDKHKSNHKKIKHRK